MNSYVKKQRSFQLMLVFMVGILVLVGAMMDYVEQPVLSRVSGFYEESFQLEISASNASAIYYTLDGSEPDETDNRYTGPITITDATLNPNNYSMRTDVSVGFYTDLIKEKQPKDGIPGYVQPDYPVDKCTVLRAVAVSPNGKKSEITSASYFVGIKPEDYNGCKIISLITDPKNLFDEEIGIYVTGNKFPEYMEQERISSVWANWNANYRMRGREWERPVLLEFFDSNGQLFLSRNSGVRTHGSYSRGSLPRSLKFYARLEYDRTESFGMPLFGGDYLPECVILNSGGNQLITQFPDYMMTQMVRELNFATMLFEPYVLFIDGEYWGFYWMSEKYDEAYVSHYYQVQQDDVVMVKNGQLETGIEADMSLYEEMTAFISGNDMSVEHNYQKACEMIDIESYVDYYAVMIYIARMEDWPFGNFSLWRTRSITNESSYSDGKWRWMLFDCNSASMREDRGLTEHDTLTYVLENDPVFKSLWNNSVFREKIRDKILLIGETYLNAEKMDVFIEDYMEQMRPILEKSWARFYGSTNTKNNDFVSRMESNRMFFNNRLAVVKSWFE